jgi:anti-sigma B factor antagonist
MSDFNIEKSEQNGVTVLRLSGMLDAHTTPNMEKTFEELIGEKKFKVVVNLKNLDYISSAGLGVFMAFVETMRENGGDIKFCEAQEKIYGVFDLLGFPVLYEFYDAEEDAVEKFNG